MKKNIFSFLLLFIAGVSFAQNNTFPTTGSVGIGTTSPQAKLQVTSPGSGQIAILGNGADSNFKIVTRQDHSSNNDGAVIAELGIDYVYSRNAAIRFHRGFSETGGFISFTSDSGLERMRIVTNGNIGIGTSNPGFKLDVVGTIRAREVKVDLSGADFVFEEDYDLMTLGELETFIQTHKHLPEIQPASEMETNGVELGVLNSKLLQKTEELTLYILQQQKEIEILKSENKLLLELESRIQNLERNSRRK